MHDLVLTDTNLSRVRDALIAGLKVAGTASSKATHYHTAAQQIEAVQEMVAKMYKVSKELPLIVAAQKGTSGFFIQEAILNELKQTTKRGHTLIVNPLDWDDDRLRDRALQACFLNLDDTAGIPYVLRMLKSMKVRKINNRRAHRFALMYLFNRDHLDFAVVKYRSKYRDILRHVWGMKLTGIMLSAMDHFQSGVTGGKDLEILRNNLFSHAPLYTEDYLCKIVRYVFNAGGEYDEREFPTIAQAILARTDVSVATRVPVEVLLGLLSDPNHPQHRDLWADKGKRTTTVKMLREANKVQTANQAVRQTKSDKKLGVVRESRVAEADDPIALLKTCYENDTWPDGMTERLNELAHKNRMSLPYATAGVILDASYSMSGHHNQSKNTPRAVSEFTFMTLRDSAHITAVRAEDGDLARAFVDLMKVNKNVEAVFILSDGYENRYDGLLSKVVKTWMQIEGHKPVFHVSPIGSAEANAQARTLGEGITSFAATYKTLPLQLQAHALESDTKLWLKLAVERLADGYAHPH